MNFVSRWALHAMGSTLLGDCHCFPYSYGICHLIGAKLDRQKRDSLKVEESEIRHERTSYLPLGKACLERLIEAWEAGGEVWSERPGRQLFS